jgi:hypothetical protein
MPLPLTSFRVAAIGPDDVSDDLLALESVVAQLSRDFAARNIHVSFIHWHKLSPGIGSPQTYIDQSISWADLDFVVGAMAARFGSGATEYECRLILDLYRRYRQPDLLFYFRDCSSALPSNSPDIDRVNAFKASLNDTLLWRAYSRPDEFLDHARSALRDKIESKLRLQEARDRFTGDFPPNRTILVEVITTSRLRDGVQSPVVIALKNGRGERFVIDTRFQSAQDVADWISQSMGFRASRDVSMRDLILQGARDAIANGEREFPMWYGDVVIEPHPQCKIDATLMQLSKPLFEADGTPNTVEKNGELRIRHIHARIGRDPEGKTCLVM